MMPLARVWSFIGSWYIPLAVAWAAFVRNGLPGEHIDAAVGISGAYWGLLASLGISGVLIWIFAIYVRRAKRQQAALLVPPNTAFETETERNPVVSWSSALVFGVAVITAVILFGSAYSDSVIYGWDAQNPLAKGFWSSREIAYEQGCPTPPCFAIQQRMYEKGPLVGVNEYVLYATDGALLLLSLIAVSGIGYLISMAGSPPGASGAADALRS